MKKINIAELLKGCPSGMALDCTCADNVVFDKIIEYDQIKCVIGECREPLILDKYARLLHICCSKCVIFPKGKTTWDGFQRPFKDGDVLIGKSGNPFIFKRLNNNKGCYSYCGIDSVGRFKLESDDWTFANSLRFATEEEKEKLFKEIKDNGYRWNPETKTLEKLIEPKFKVGDRIKYRHGETVYRIVHITEDSYVLDNLCSIYISIEHMYDLVPNKFDISTLKPFDKVLVRNVGVWEPAFWGYYSKGYVCPFVVAGGNTFAQCVPYEENKHLLGTTNDCDEYYKTWK